MRWSIGARNADLPPGRCASRATARKTMRGLEPSGSMNRFAQLLDRLAFEHGRNAKLRLMTEYFRTTPDPERGFALAALTGALTFQHAKPGIIRALIAERTDPVLFELSYDYVGDLSETVALMWPASPSPVYGEGRGGGSRLLRARGFPLPNPPAEVGSIRLRPTKNAEIGQARFR